MQRANINSFRIKNASGIKLKKLETCIKFTTTGLPTFEKQCPDAHFVCFLFCHYCSKIRFNVKKYTYLCTS